MTTIFNSNKTNQKGFTLLEIMVAVAIIAIAFTSVLKLYTQTVAMTISSNFYAKAPFLAQKIISEWETGLATDTTQLDTGSFIEEFPGFSFELRHDTLSSDLIYSDNLSDTDRILVEVVCTILYNNGEYDYTTKALRFLPQ